MAQISRSDYETLTVECEHCGTECVFNRREDFSDVGPFDGKNVVCPACNAGFRMVGDTINPPYEMFTFAAEERFQAKHYMQAVANMAQAWELFFATFAFAQYIYRPFFAVNRPGRDTQQLNALLLRLSAKIDSFTFFPLRNLLINTIAGGVSPGDLAEAAIAIDNISPGMGNDPPQAVRSSVANPTIRQLLEDLCGLTVGHLRNKVLHHSAYRPLRSEAERCVDNELEVMYRAKRVFRIGTFEEFQAGAV